MLAWDSGHQRRRLRELTSVCTNYLILDSSSMFYELRERPPVESQTFITNILSETDKKCPFTGMVSIRGRILTGTVVSTKMHRTLIVRREYLHFIPKYARYEKRHTNLAAHVSPAFRVVEGDQVTVGQCRPLSKTVCGYAICKSTWEKMLGCSSEIEVADAYYRFDSTSYEYYHVRARPSSNSTSSRRQMSGGTRTTSGRGIAWPRANGDCNV